MICTESGVEPDCRARSIPLKYAMQRLRVHKNGYAAHVISQASPEITEICAKIQYADAARVALFQSFLNWFISRGAGSLVVAVFLTLDEQGLVVGQGIS